MTPGGAGACLSDVLCPLVEPCGAMNNCPPGFICAINTCCPGKPDICLPLTGSCVAGAARPGPPITQSGWTASGQYIDAGD